MAGVLATVTLPYTTGLPEDTAVNTFVFDNDTGSEQTTLITELLVDFYTTVSGSFSVGSMISEIVDRNTDACTIDLANIVSLGPVGSVEVGPVYFTDTFTLTAAHGSGTAVSLPLEVAIVNSVSGPGSPLVPVARRRGRQYIGPLDIVVLATGGPYPYVDPTFTALLAEMSEDLAVASTAADVPWCVWSRTEPVLTVIESGFINNEFDTQRRRGADASARVNWTISV